MGAEELPAADFVATLTRNEEVKNIGIKVTFPNPNFLVVTALNPDGLVPRWNASCQESQKIQVQDRIVFVNGKHGSFDIMMKEIKDSKVMEVGILRTPTVAASAPATDTVTGERPAGKPPRTSDNTESGSGPMSSLKVSLSDSKPTFGDEISIIPNEPGEVEPDAPCCVGSACLGR